MGMKLEFDTNYNGTGNCCTCGAIVDVRFYEAHRRWHREQAQQVLKSTGPDLVPGAKSDSGRSS